jgi:hypothetical protein
MADEKPAAPAKEQAKAKPLPSNTAERKRAAFSAGAGGSTIIGADDKKGDKQ